MSFRRGRQVNKKERGILKRPVDSKPKYTERRPSLPTIHFSAPRASSLKVVALDDSLKSSQTDPVRSTSFLAGTVSIRSANATKKKKKKKNLTWKNIEIREYSRICGDNPSCSSGVPISIGWDHTETFIMPLIAYEGSRPPRRSNQEMLMSRNLRRSMLMNEWDVHPTEIAVAIRTNQHIKNRRRKTVNNVGTAASTMEEIAERIKRNTKRFVLFQPSSGQEALALTEEAQKAHEQRLNLVAAQGLMGESKSSSSDGGNGGDTVGVGTSLAAIAAALLLVDCSDPAGGGDTAGSLSAPAAAEVFLAESPNTAHPEILKHSNDTARINPPSAVEEAWGAAPVISSYTVANTAMIKGGNPGSVENKALVATAAATGNNNKVVIVTPTSSENTNDQDEQEDLQMPMFAGMPSPDGNDYDVELLLDDDEISQLTEGSRTSVKLSAENGEHRHRIAEEANQRYQETKQLEDRIRELEDRRAADEANQKKSWFVIPAPKSPKQCASSRRVSSAKKSPVGSKRQLAAAPKQLTVVTKKFSKSPPPQNVGAGSDDEFST